MEISYELSKADFLAQQLHALSKSKSHAKKRFRARVLIPIIYLILGLSLYLQKNQLVSALIFAVIAVIWFIFYPLFSKWRYKNHYENHINENYKNRINRPVELKLGLDSIHAKDSTTETTINKEALTELIEFQDYFLIKLQSEMSMIIPKRFIPDPSEFKKIIIGYGAEYIDELAWVW